MIYILRNNQQYGPYDPQVLKSYIEEGKILLNDKAFLDGPPNNIQTAGYFLKQYGIKTKIKHQGNLFKQIKDIGGELILPKDVFSRKELMKDKRLIHLALIGLTPAFLIRITSLPSLTFYTISLYFSAIWGFFFFYFFKTNQVSSKITIFLFFFVQLFVFLLWNLFLLPQWPVVGFFYNLTESSNWFLRLAGFILGVGLCEEVAKAIPLLIIVKTAREPLIPQTMVFYGLISGISFGVFEGVQHQTQINISLDYANAFFMNVARLTSLPFLHAIWTGIAGYFIAFSNLYPKYRISLSFLTVGIPALIHGLYNTLGWSILGLILTLLSVILLISYLKKGFNYQSKLSG